MKQNFKEFLILLGYAVTLVVAMYVFGCRPAPNADSPWKNEHEELLFRREQVKFLRELLDEGCTALDLFDEIYWTYKENDNDSISIKDLEDALEDSGYNECIENMDSLFRTQL